MKYLSIFPQMKSTEEHRYVEDLAKVKRAFESLIRAKEHLVVSLPEQCKELLYDHI